jgi:hypothetical protein
MAINRVQNGFRLFMGEVLNSIIDTVNGITGGTGPVSATTVTTGAIAGSDSSLGITGQAAQTATAAGGAVAIAAAAGGATSGAGGNATLTAGAGTAGVSNGGNVVLTAGAKSSTGKDGSLYQRVNGAAVLKTQGAPAAKTVTAAITAAELVAGLITTTGATGPSVHQLPTGTLIDAELPGVVTGDSFDFCVINTGTGASTDATITVNTDVTIVGNPTIGSLTDATIISGSGLFRCRRTAANTYVVYRLA